MLCARGEEEFRGSNDWALFTSKQAGTETRRNAAIRLLAAARRQNARASCVERR
jgi:hypothetical protein